MPKYEVSYAEDPTSGNQHLNSVQEWGVKMVGGRVVNIQLAGFRRNGDRNTFAMKHLLTPSKKGTAQDVKAEHKLMHRLDHQGNKAFNPHQGAKATDATAQTRADKYGSAAKLSATATDAYNSCIDLSLISLQTALEKIAAACDAANWGYAGPGHVTVNFGVACVRKVQAHWNGAAALATISHHPTSATVNVTGQRIGDTSFEIYHLG